MTEHFEFKIIGSIGELNLSQSNGNFLKTEFRCLSDLEYELFLTFLGTHRIMCGRILLNQVLLCNKTGVSIHADQNNLTESSTFKVSLWKSLQLPFTVDDFTISNKSLWALGKDFYVDISSHVKHVFNAEKPIKEIDDLMDTGSNDEFQFQEFESSVKIESTEKYKPESEKFYMKCSLFNSSIIICTKDVLNKTWQLDLLVSAYDVAFTAEHPKSIPIINFPCTYAESFSSENSCVENWKLNKQSLKPVITLTHVDESIGQGHNVHQTSTLHKLLDTFPALSSNCICFVGHPEGILLYCLCTLLSEERNFKVNTQLEVLYDIKQPIIGIYFLKEVNGFKGNGFLLIVGALGKLVYITAAKSFSNSDVIKIKNETFHTTTLYLTSSVQKHIVFSDYVFHTSNKGDLWVSEFSKLESRNSSQKEDLKFFRNTIIMQGILEMILLNERQGLFLFVTQCGNLYLSQYPIKKIQLNATISLPSLMNEIMQQSTMLQNLSSISGKQQDFFAAVSKFASFKFSGVQKLKVTCSMTEIDEPPKKLVISLNIASSEELTSDFWYVTTSLYSFYQKDSVVLSKTLPYEANQTIFIEVQESLLCPPYCSPFPLYLEVGLLLTLPESFVSEDCFKHIAKVLPLYIKIETLTLNELYLLKPKKQCLVKKSQNRQQSSKNVLKDIFTRHLKTPVAHVLRIQQKIFANCPQDFRFCLLRQKIQKIGEDTFTELSLVGKILQTLKNRSNLPDACDLSSLICKNQEMSLSISNITDGDCITAHTRSFFLLAGLHMATAELLINIQDKSIPCGSKGVGIPVMIYKECEKLSKDLTSMYGQDARAVDFLDKVILVYCQLRNVSEMLPFC